MCSFVGLGSGLGLSDLHMCAKEKKIFFRRSQAFTKEKITVEASAEEIEMEIFNIIKIV